MPRANSANADLAINIQIFAFVCPHAAIRARNKSAFPFDHQIQLHLMDFTFRITQMTDDLIHCPVVTRGFMLPVLLCQRGGQTPQDSRRGDQDRQDRSRDLNDGSSVDKLMDSSHGRRSANLPRPASNPGLEADSPSIKNVFSPSRCAGIRSRAISFPTIRIGPSGQPSRPSTSA